MLIFFCIELTVDLSFSAKVTTMLSTSLISCHWIQLQMSFRDSPPIIQVGRDSPTIIQVGLPGGECMVPVSQLHYPTKVDYPRHKGLRPWDES